MGGCCIAGRRGERNDLWAAGLGRLAASSLSSCSMEQAAEEQAIHLVAAGLGEAAATHVASRIRSRIAGSGGRIAAGLDRDSNHRYSG